jgi:hypothetical protein
MRYSRIFSKLTSKQTIVLKTTRDRLNITRKMKVTWKALGTFGLG